MTASVLKQDPNTKGFKRTLIYFDRTHSMLCYVLTWKNSTLYFDTGTQYSILCVRVKINKRSFEPCCVSIE